mgnify:CR=1 FL=1
MKSPKTSFPVRFSAKFRSLLPGHEPTVHIVAVAIGFRFTGCKTTNSGAETVDIAVCFSQACVRSPRHVRPRNRRVRMSLGAGMRQGVLAST